MHRQEYFLPDYPPAAFEIVEGFILQPNEFDVAARSIHMMAEAGIMGTRYIPWRHKARAFVASAMEQGGIVPPRSYDVAEVVTTDEAIYTIIARTSVRNHMLRPGEPPTPGAHSLAWILKHKDLLPDFLRDSCP